MKKIYHNIKHLVPWMIAAAIFFYLFWQYPPKKVWESLAYVNIPAFLSFSLIYFFLLYFLDAWSIKDLMKRFGYAATLGGLLLGRGVTYLVMIVNYPASQAAFAYYLRRKYNTPIFRALGIFLFIVFVDLLWIITLAFIGSSLQDYNIGGIDLKRTIQIVALITYSGAAIWMMFWKMMPKKIDGHGFIRSVLRKIKERDIFQIFSQAGISDYVRIAITRAPIHMAIIFYMYIVLQTFDVSCPIIRILGNVPVVFMIGTLPITPGGLGTTNAAMVELLSPYITSPLFESGRISPREMLFAITILWMATNYVIKAIVGTILMKRVSKNLFKPTLEFPQEIAEKEATHMHGNI
ncbi:MAG TPA: lysylphosphatidylglycerol synthase transmembrane domain-containing protein [bacterium]|nr:lysylphosphatidylglycerol synthase transmembrane domain-containing protein [bacterium]